MESQDRRVARTKKWLKKAFLDLVLEKAYEDITIQEIADRADTARITFYRHYRDKEELLLDCLEGLYHELIQYVPELSIERVSDPSAPPPILLLYQYLDTNFQLYRRLLSGSVSALVNKRLREYIVQAVLQAIDANPMDKPLPVPIEIFANQLAATFLGMIVWWLENDKPYPMEYIARFSYWFGMTGIKGTLNLSIDMAAPDLHYSG